jgi:uncharacterized protein
MTNNKPKKKREKCIALAAALQAEQLYSFAWTGNIAALEDVLSNGAVVDMRSQGETALMKASWEQQADAVRVLLRHHADPNIQSETSGHTALHKAAWRGHENIVQQLLAANADLTLTNKYGNTALHEAAAAGNIAVMDLLIEAGANMATTNNWGMTPEQFAVKNNQPEAAKYLQYIAFQQSLGLGPAKPSAPRRHL